MGKSEEEAKQNSKKRRRRKILFILFSATVLLLSAWVFVKIFRQRSGEEIYNAVFGAPVPRCTNIINKKDHHVPIIDCCIWLHFTSCPEEINRIIHNIDTASYKLIKKYLPPSASREQPSWWKPEKSGSDQILLCYYNSNEAHYRIFYISKDSTEVYYQDLVY
jgi:hypothetical protein